MVSPSPKKTPTRGLDKSHKGGMVNPIMSILLMVTIVVLLFCGAIVQYHATLGIENESRSVGDFVSNIIKRDIEAIEKADIPGKVSQLEGELIHRITGVIEPVTSHTNVHEEMSHHLPMTNSASEMKKRATVPLKQHILTCPHNELVSYCRAPTEEDAMYVTPYATAGPGYSLSCGCRRARSRDV